MVVDLPHENDGRPFPPPNGHLPGPSGAVTGEGGGHAPGKMEVKGTLTSDIHGAIIARDDMNLVHDIIVAAASRGGKCR